MCGFANLIVVMCQSGVAKSDILMYGEGEVCVVLEEDGHGGTEVGQSESFDVSIIDEDGALCWVVDPGDKFQDRALSRAVCSDNDL